MRVLYVDDDRVNSLLFVEVCRTLSGITVQVAHSASEALDLLEQFGADLLVLDLHLPDGDGLSLLPALQQRAASRLPAYLCTADEPELVESRALAAGFDGCWSKPLDIAGAVSVLKRHSESLRERS